MPLNPYLSFDGNCQEAFAFYHQCLGGEIEAMIAHAGTPAEEHVPPEWKDKIMHARLNLGDGVLMGGDAPPGMYQPPKGISVALQIKDPAQADKIYAALSEGGSITMPIGETFWAVRFAMFVDRFGIPWMINCEAAR
jgi:PhnB protein